MAGLFGTAGSTQNGIMRLFAPGASAVGEKLPVAQSRRSGGLIGGLQRAFDPSRLAMTQALLDGDYGAAAGIAAQAQRARAEQEQARAEAAARESLMNNLVKETELGGFGLSPGEAERVMANPQAFGAEYASRFRTRELAPDSELRTPNGGGRADTYRTAPPAAPSPSPPLMTGEEIVVRAPQPRTPPPRTLPPSPPMLPIGDEEMWRLEWGAAGPPDRWGLLPR